MDVAAWFSDNRTTIVNVILIFAVAWLVKRFGQIALRRAIRRAVRSTAHHSLEAEQKREETITQIVSGALHIVVWPIAVILAVAQIGVDIAPLVAGASIIGVALGFGAQSLVKDIISGLFIIVENQYRVGDVVDLDGTAGIVERITLRVTVLRDLDGIVHHIPNGTIDRTSNFTKEYSGVNLNIRVAYDSDLDKVIETVNRVGQELAGDKAWQDKLLEAPKFLRVDNFADDAIEVKITGTTKPLMQWEISGELRMRLKAAFDKAGIEIPLPQRVIHSKKAG